MRRWLWLMVAMTMPVMAFDEAAFFARQDMVWHQLPVRWEDGAFLGNGQLGAMVYREGNALRWEVNSTQIVDHRDELDPLLARPRMPLGHLLLKPVGAISAGQMRVDLWNATLRATVVTDKGTLAIEARVVSGEPGALMVEMRSTGEERRASWQWLADEAINPRKVKRGMPITADDRNPAPVLKQMGPVTLSIQPIHEAEYGVRWMEESSEEARILYLNAFWHVGRTLPEEGQALERVARWGAMNWKAQHESDWHRYWRRSFVSLPDTRLENFYWIQMYKLYSATRASGRIIDNQGPWFRPTPWPALWWNLNVELSYWPIYESNRQQDLDSLSAQLLRDPEVLKRNAPKAWQSDTMALGRASSYDLRAPVMEPKLAWNAKKPDAFELGDLVWALHNLWLGERYAGGAMSPRLRDALEKAVNLYVHQLIPDDQGFFHTPEAISPEYPETAMDTNYDLALLRWGLRTLLAETPQPSTKAEEWRNLLAHLTPYPRGVDGFWIGRNLPMTVSHRHFSHLLMIYPLREISGATPEERALIETSLNTWIGKPGALQGYSFVGASAMLSMLGEGDRALDMLNKLLDGYVEANTMYMESGPVIETPLAGAQAIHEMLLQSWGGVLRVFPALPSTWKDVAFDRLRGEGGLLVSAVRHEGKLVYIRIESTVDGPIKIKGDGVQGLLGDQLSWHDGVGEVMALSGDVLEAGSARPAPVSAQADRVNWFGGKHATAGFPTKRQRRP